MGEDNKWDEQKKYVSILDTTGMRYTFYEIEKRKETIKRENKNKEDRSKEKKKEKK